MNEAYLKSRLREALVEAMPGVVVMRHEDKFAAGIPDMSVSWGGVTSWIEVKYSRRKRKAKATPLQLQMLNCLAQAGVPAYLLTYEEGFIRDVMDGKNLPLNLSHLDRVRADKPVVTVTMHPAARGTFNHAEVAAAIRHEHERKA